MATMTCTPPGKACSAWFSLTAGSPRQRTQRDRPTSEFHLRNDHWDIVGLDTSWKFRLGDIRGGAGHLQQRQSRWVPAQPGPARRIGAAQNAALAP